MKLRLYAPLVAILIALAACAPTLVEREIEELIAPAPYAETYELVINAINTQPYPSNSGGWVIVQADQVGGFVSAELNYSVWKLGQGTVAQSARVAITLVDR
jgi:hypothetical protein